MSEVAVEVSHLWKKFHRGEFHDSLRDLVPALAKRLVGRGPKRSDLAEGDFWALKDVNFQVRKGEVLGIIGPNGAGKSTLLKILSKILKPNRGSVKVVGRLRALIEVAAGFHGDLTGRENIYLNGSILGMKKREIDAKFDQIVDFAGIPEFLDTPVKRYSSGMHARLGFAVAAHLDPEILIVDEVLSVGDAEFQKKCLGKMEDVAHSNRTVLFVSHNMAAVKSLCTRAVLLQRGQIVAEGDPGDVIQGYYDRIQNGQHAARAEDEGNGKQRILRSVALLDESGAPTSYLPMGGDFRLRIELNVVERIDSPAIAFGIDSVWGERLLTVQTPVSHSALPSVEGRCAVECRVARFPLSPGEYSVKVAIAARGGELDARERAASFTVIDADSFGEGTTFRRGLCVAASQWTIARKGDDHE